MLFLVYTQFQQNYVEFGNILPPFYTMFGPNLISMVVLKSQKKI